MAATACFKILAQNVIGSLSMFKVLKSVSSDKKNIIIAYAKGQRAHTQRALSVHELPPLEQPFGLSSLFHKDLAYFQINLPEQYKIEA